MKCKLISIEGTDGSGKATTVELLKNYLLNNNAKVESISFPRYSETLGGKLLYEVLKSERKDNYNFINSSPDTASLLFAMDRIESKNWLNQLVKDNDYLLFDRYVDSNLIHQAQKLNTNEERDQFSEYIYNIEYNINQLPRPDIVIFLYLDPNISIQRTKERALLENRQVDAGEGDYNYISRSSECGLYIAKKYNWIIINCMDEKTNKQKSRESILEEIIEILK